MPKYNPFTLLMSRKRSNEFEKIKANYFVDVEKEECYICVVGICLSEGVFTLGY
jgi:hypothetical protein